MTEENWVFKNGTAKLGHTGQVAYWRVRRGDAFGFEASIRYTVRQTGRTQIEKTIYRDCWTRAGALRWIEKMTAEITAELEKNAFIKFSEFSLN